MNENGTRSVPYEELDKMPIAGEWRDGRAGKTLADTNPYTGETLLELNLAGADDLDEAYRAAKKPSASGPPCCPSSAETS